MTQPEELRASELLLDLGVSIPVRPLRFLFSRKRRSVTMRTPGAGGVIRIANKYLKIGVTYEEMRAMDFDGRLRFVAGHGKEVSELVAYAIVRGYVLGRLFNKLVAWWLRWRVHPAYLNEAMMQLLTNLDITSFFDTIRSAQAMNLTARRLSHSGNGS